MGSSFPPGRSARRIALVMAAVVLCLAAPCATRILADVRPLTLYEKIGRAPLVAWAEVADDSERRARIRTLEVLKCTILQRPGETFRIAYKLDSFLRPPWEERITFATGERLILFLRKFTKEDGEQPEGDVYTLMWGGQGKVLLPLEGESAWLEAARTFASIQADGDPERRAAALRAHLGSGNAILSDGAFEEAVKQAAGDLEMIPGLVSFLQAPRDATRGYALRLLRQILDDARVARRPVPGAQDLADRLQGRLIEEPSASVRADAVRALASLGGEPARAFLARLAREDPSQEVRYAAERALLDWTAAP